MTTLEAAKLYVSREFMFIVIPPRSKNPGRKDWPKLALTAKDDLSKHFRARKWESLNGELLPPNIGILLGDQYGTADVDLDAPEAIAAAKELLPETRHIRQTRGCAVGHEAANRATVRERGRADSGDSVARPRGDLH